jgi:hypothetical protein
MEQQEPVMEYRGRVKGGVIVLDEGPALAEGAEVRVVPVQKPEAAGNGQGAETTGQRLMKFAGKAKGLPADAARNHDHYLYGAPKR